MKQKNICQKQFFNRGIALIFFWGFLLTGLAAAGSNISCSNNGHQASETNASESPEVPIPDSPAPGGTETPDSSSSSAGNNGEQPSTNPSTNPSAKPTSIHSSASFSSGSGLVHSQQFNGSAVVSSYSQRP